LSIWHILIKTHWMDNIIHIYIDMHELAYFPINNESLTKIYDLLINNIVIENPSNITELFYLGTWHQINDDINKAMEYYQKGLELNDPMSMYRIANIYSHPNIKYEKNFKLAFEYFNKLASQNFDYALITLGDIYFEKSLDFGIEINIDLANEYYQKAISSDNEYLFSRLSSIHKDNKNKQIKYEFMKDNAKRKTLSYYLDFLNNYYDNNNNDILDLYKFALNHVASHYKHIEHDVDKAIEYYEKLANLNDCDSQRVPISKLYKCKILNDCEILNELGYIFLNNKKDVTKAIEYYEKSANLNNVLALEKLGKIYVSFINDDYNENHFLLALKYYVRCFAITKNESTSHIIGMIYFIGYLHTNNYDFGDLCIAYSKNDNIHENHVLIGDYNAQKYDDTDEIKYAELAIYHYKKALETTITKKFIINQNLSKVYENICIDLNSVEHINAGIECCEQCLQIDKKHVKILENIIHSYLLKYNLTSDIECFDIGVKYIKMIDDYEKNAYLLLLLGTFYSLHSEMNKSTESCKKSLEYSNKSLSIEKNSGIYGTLGLTHIITNEYDKALEYLELAYDNGDSYQKTESRVHIKKIIENYNVNWTFPSHKFWIDIVNIQFKKNTMLLLLYSRHKNISIHSYIKLLFNKNVAISIIGQLAILYKNETS